MVERTTCCVTQSITGTGAAQLIVNLCLIYINMCSIHISENGLKYSRFHSMDHTFKICMTMYLANEVGNQRLKDVKCRHDC